jgi:predicted nucleotidyltransferase
MKRDLVLQLLANNRADLRQFGVKSLYLFGSVARNEATERSDIDFLVEFDRPTGFFGLIRLQQFLENLLKCRADICTPGGLRPRLREHILMEAIRAA